MNVIYCHLGFAVLQVSGFWSEKVVATKLDVQTMKLKRRVKGSWQDYGMVGLPLEEEREEKITMMLWEDIT